MSQPKYSPYEILNIPFNATPKEVKRSYKKLIRQYTPEHHPEEFMDIRSSYEFLTDGYQFATSLPIYKKPLVVMVQKSQNDQHPVELPRSILATFFETPFDTIAQLDHLLHLSEKEMGFANEPQNEPK